MRRDPCRRGFTFIELLVVTAIIAVLAFLSTPSYSCGGRRRPNQRACFANQKTIAGAVEMYNLDFNTNVTRLTPELAQRFEEEGYLQQYPRDPGGLGEYRLWPLNGNGVYCTEHGPIQGPHPDAWKALRQGTLEQELDLYGAAGVDWLLRTLREQSDAELRRTRYEGAAIGAMLALGIPAGFALLYLAFVLPMRRSMGDHPPGCDHASPEAAGILLVTATRGLGESWPLAAPEHGAACPVCAEGFLADHAAAESCPRCLAPHHPECREFNRGCGIYACGQR